MLRSGNYAYLRTLGFAASSENKEHRFNPVSPSDAARMHSTAFRMRLDRRLGVELPDESGSSLGVDCLETSRDGTWRCSVARRCSVAWRCSVDEDSLLDENVACNRPSVRHTADVSGIAMHGYAGGREDCMQDLF